MTNAPPTPAVAHPAAYATIPGVNAMTNAPSSPAVAKPQPFVKQRGVNPD
jgi:hypothetical protein